MACSYGEAVKAQQRVKRDCLGDAPALIGVSRKYRKGKKVFYRGSIGIIINYSLLTTGKPFSLVSCRLGKGCKVAFHSFDATCWSLGMREARRHDTSFW